MANKTAVIFGGTGGIGSEIGRQLATGGLTVVALGRQSVDVANDESVSLFFTRNREKMANVKVVVFSVSAPLENKQVLSSKTSWADYAKHLDIQLHGMFNIVRGFSEQIKAGNKIKFILLLTEACVGKPPSGLAHYVSAKYALMGLAKTLAVELAKYGCAVNMVSPGMVETDLTSGFPEKLKEITAAQNPLGRLTTAQDVAKTVLFLASDDSSHLNGVNILVNGGEVMV
jgi:3-oxoacyl-[acyl-carrier protein] reductase